MDYNSTLFLGQLFFLISSSETHVAIIENVNFIMGITIFLKKARVLTKDGFESFLGPSWARFGLFWGYFGSCLVVHFGIKKRSSFVLAFTWVRLVAFCC